MNVKIILIMWLSIVATGCSSLRVKQGNALFKEGVDLFNRGDCENATLKFSNAIQRNQNLGQAYLYMANCALKKSDLSESFKLAKKAVPIISDKNSKMELAMFFFTSGHVVLKNKDYDNAILFFEECVSLAQEDISCHLWLGNAFLERGNDGDMRRAISEFKAEIEKSKNPDDITLQIREFLFERAKKYSSQNDAYHESGCYMAYTENFLPDIEAYIALGRIFLKIGNPIGSLYYANKAYALDPKNEAVRELMDGLSTPIH